jgi:hypothetical protein
MPYNSETGLYERRSTTVIDATPDGDTVAVAIDDKLDAGIDDAVTDLNHHDANGNHYPDVTVTTTKQYLAKSPAGSVSWRDGVPLDEAVESTLLAATDGSDMVGYGAGTVTDALDSHASDIATNATAISANSAALAASGGSALVGFLQDGTGATARTAQAKMRERLSFADFGVIADGATDNNTALLAIRDHMLSDNDKLWEIEAHGGTICYSDNRWLVDVKHVRIVGNNTEFRNLSTSATSNTARPLFQQAIFDGDIFTNVFDVHQGVLINAADAGAGSVTATTAAEAAKITAGEWALVWGYDQQGFNGYLPNGRYFDWLLVESVNAGTGVITFAGGNRLRNKYNTNWLDGVSGSVETGKPRIISTVRTIAQGYSANRTFPVTRIFEDVSFSCAGSAGKNWGPCAVFVQADRLQNKTTGAFYTALGAKMCVYDGLTFNQGAQRATTEYAIESDKLTELCIVRNSALSHTGDGGTGVDRLVYDGVSFCKDARFSPSAKYIEVNNCELNGVRSISQPQFVLQYANTPVKSFVFNNTRFILNDDQLGIMRAASIPKSIPSGAWTTPGLGQILLSGASTATYAGYLDIGTLVVIGDTLIDGSANWGIIQSIEASGSDVLLTLRGHKAVALDETKAITYYNANAPTFDNGCSVVRRDGSIVNQPLTAVTPAFLNNADTFKTIRWGSLQNRSLTYGVIYYPCYISEVRVNVRRTYTGADAECKVELSRVEQGSQRIQIDLKTAGYRRINAGESVGVGGADSVVSGFLSNPNLKGINCLIRSTTGGSLLPADVATSDYAPIYTVEMDLVPLVI